MSALFRNSVMMGILLSIGSAVAQTQAPAPVLLFTDLITGANSGGEGGNGVYITIYGKNFGVTQGSSTVTVGGAPVAQYKIWGSHNGVNPALDKVVVQIGPSNPSGNIVMTVNGVQSNPLPFTVCSGHIYFVSPSGSDSAAGTSVAPWATPVHAKSVMTAGDTVYIHAGTWASQDNFSAAFDCYNQCSGTSSAYQNFVGYPGEVATIGGAGVGRGIYAYPNGMSYVTFANLTLRASTNPFTCQNSGPCNYIRTVGNDMRALTNTSEAWDLETSATNIVVYGNESGYNCQGDSGCSYDARSYSLYIGGYGAQSYFDIGWNRLHDNVYGKGVQVYGHAANDSLTGLKIHDNFMYNNGMVAIASGGNDVQPGVDFVRDAMIYNNIFWNNNYGVTAAHSNFGGIEITSINANVDTYQIYNNTFYANSPAHSIPAGGAITFAGAGTYSTTIRDNILYTAPDAPCYTYFEDSSSATVSHVTFSNNLYYGAGTGPSNCNGSTKYTTNPDAHAVNADPLFVSTSLPDFHLTSSSPAIDAGMNTGIAIDYDGNPRPQGAAYDIGAYEFVPGTSTNRPLPPTNLTVTVQ